MTRLAAWLLALALVCGTVAASVAVAHEAPSTAGTPAPTAERGTAVPALTGTPTDESGTPDGGMGMGMGGGNDSAPMGGVVSSVIGMEEASVDASVRIARFEERFAAADTDRERAAVVAATLNATAARVATLERRLETLRARRMNGSISQGWFDVEVSWLLSTAEHQGEITRRLERAARPLPPDVLADHGASVERIERVGVRVERLLTTAVPDIHRTTFDRRFYRQFASFVERFNASANGTETDALAPLAGELVVLAIESDADDGSPVVLSFRSTDAVRFEAVRAGGRADPTVRLETDVATARRLVTATRPRRALAAAVRNRSVTVRSVES